MKFLKKKSHKKEIEEMIWEVDEDLDGCLNWDEFKLMYGRNIQDTTGLEPSRMVELLRISNYYFLDCLMIFYFF